MTMTSVTEIVERNVMMGLEESGDWNGDVNQCKLEREYAGGSKKKLKSTYKKVT